MKDDTNPNYYGILPATVRYDDSISPFAKILYTEITALSNKEGFCYASNAYFGKLYHKGGTWVSKTISSLEVAGHIRVELSENRNERRIYPLVENYKGGSGKVQAPASRKVQHNSTSINTKTIKEETPSEYAKDFFSGGKHYEGVRESLMQKVPEALVDRELQKFVLYWTEPNKSGTKVRWEQQPTFEVKRRLVTWLRNVKEFSERSSGKVGREKVIIGLDD